MFKYDLDKCVGCRVCEIVCSAYHLKKFAPNRARLTVRRPDEVTMAIDYCHHCKNAPCSKACPVDAFYEVAGVQYIDSDKCIECGNCVEACPFDAVMIDANLGTAIKCDLCDGNVYCSKFCPQGVIEVDQDKLAKFTEKLEGK